MPRHCSALLSLESMERNNIETNIARRVPTRGQHEYGLRKSGTGHLELPVNATPKGRTMTGQTQFILSSEETVHDDDDDDENNYEVYIAYNRTTKLMEVFSGHAQMETTPKMNGWTSLGAFDIQGGWDLKVRAHREEPLKIIMIDEQKPDVVVIATPCTKWCQWTYLRKDKEKLEEEHTAEGPLLCITRQVILRQARAGRTWVLENPAASLLWQQPLLEDIIKKPETRTAKIDMCAYDLKDPVSGMPNKKATMIASNNPALTEYLTGKCKCKEPHQRLEGSSTAGRRTTLAGKYTDKLCQAIVDTVSASAVFIMGDDMREINETSTWWTCSACQRYERGQVPNPAHSRLQGQCRLAEAPTGAARSRDEVVPPPKASSEEKPRTRRSEKGPENFKAEQKVATEEASPPTEDQAAEDKEQAARQGEGKRSAADVLGISKKMTALRAAEEIAKHVKMDVKNIAEALTAPQQLHLQHHHLSATEMKKALKAAGAEPKLLQLADEVVARCSTCNLWQPMPNRPTSRMPKEKGFNQVVIIGSLFDDASKAL